jgi:Flp pilus assembly protein TadG
MAKIESGRRRERGVTLVLMALMLFLVLGMSALAVDYGMIKAAKAEAQRAMDAAALAGASAFQVGDPAFNFDSAARVRAKEYALQHAVHKVVVDTAPPPAGNLTIQVDLGAEKVTAIYNGHGIPLWFANIFGSSTMSISAFAAAHATAAGASACLMPVALPDLWVNSSPDAAEDGNGNSLVDFADRNDNRQWDWDKKDADNEPWEVWEYNPGEGDYYNPPNSDDATGYGSPTRDGYTDPLTGQPRASDYGRKMVLMAHDPGSTEIPSNYLAWGHTGEEASDSALAARIRDLNCEETVIGDDYVRAANGSKPNLGDDWEYRINQDPNWTWNDATNSAECSGDVPRTPSCGDFGNSPRVVIIGLYDPIILTAPNDNEIQFINFAKVFIENRVCTGPPGNCKAETTGRFLGPAEGIGSPGGETGPLVKKLELIE